MLENVVNLMWIDGGCMKAGRTGAALATVLAALKGAGYTVLHRPLNAKDWLPQQRERLYVERRIYSIQCPQYVYVHRENNMKCFTT